ncbi:hypothetical protein [Corynebacterium lubricantis]|uniref:hypothetical protein n=1 Tax=Corynebacterium lubricantis TaxID=541095 RepID=UPI0003605ED9|nr:hypothetical protein [Corynebacterium lubricantis]
MARSKDQKRISPAALGAAGLTGSVVALGGAATATAADIAVVAQQAGEQYPNYGAWASSGLQWEWFYVIIAVLAVVSLVVTIYLSGKNSRRNGRREGGL